MSDDEELPQLDAWEAMEPPDGFAERVLAARDVAVQQKRPRRLRAMAGAALLMAAAAVWLIAVRSGDASGEATAKMRTSIRLGDRGIAVAEQASRLRWRVHRGAARVEQSAGDVFYRVEHGGPFVVSTAAGDVTVQGTCFRVEVDPMVKKQSLVAASVGAIAATTILVTVYEGKVLLANEHGRITVAAGHQASARSDSAPEAPKDFAALQHKYELLSRMPGQDLSRDELLRRDQAQRAELEKLRARVQELQAAASSDSSKKPEEPFFQPSHDELLAMAKDCKLKWDYPSVGLNPQTVGDKMAEKLGLSDAERAAINRVNAQVNQQVLQQLRALYVEVTGDKSGADTLTPQALENEILSMSPQPLTQQVFYALSHERAGLQAPPTDATGESPVERLMRMMTHLGDDYEQKLAAEIGADRAHELRQQNNGWSSRSQSSLGCPGE